MPGKELKVEGKEEVTRAFDKLSDSVEDLSDVNEEISQKLMGDVRANTRVRTGDLRASWEGKGDPKAAQFSNPQKYAVVQEMGSSQIEPTYAVQRAFEANQDAITGSYEKGITERAKRADIATR